MRTSGVVTRALCLCAALLITGSFVQSGDPVEDKNWTRIRLDERFRSEGAAAADFNHDGTMDVVAGDVWYASPGADSTSFADGKAWKLHELRDVGEFVAGKGYSNSFCNFAADIDQDGWDDVILVGFPGDPFHWYRNPGKEGFDQHWKQHVIWSSICNESPEFEDVDGDDVPEIVFGSQPEAKMGFVKIPQPSAVEETWPFLPISEQGDPMQNGTFKYYHGLGVGDVNGDGRDDVVIAHGWWEQPKADATKTVWAFHPIRFETDAGPQPIPSAANIYVDDLDLDGDADLIASSAHEYGVWWFENTGDGWKKHDIDSSYSQTHAVEMVDVNGDGQKDFVTGKRFFAHNGNDPGGNDPVVMYWYEIQRKKGQPPQITPHEIVAGRDTGIGTQFTIADMNGDRKPDIVLSNKKGVNVLVQN